MGGGGHLSLKPRILRGGGGGMCVLSRTVNLSHDGAGLAHSGRAEQEQ